MFECEVCGKTERMSDEIRYRVTVKRWLCGRCFRAYKPCNICGKLGLTITTMILRNYETTYLCIQCINKPIFITWW